MFILSSRAVSTAPFFTLFMGTLRPHLTLLLDVVSIHTGTKSLWKKGMPSVRASAESRCNSEIYGAICASSQSTRICFNTVRNLINRREPRIEKELRQAVADAIRSLRPESLDKLFRKVIYGDP